MNDALINYLPLLLLIISLSVCAYLIWRSEYNIGALLIQLGTAAFLSTLAAYGLWIIGVIMIVSALLPESEFAWRVNLILCMSVGSTAGYSMVKRFGTSSEDLSLFDIGLSLILSVVGAVIGFILFFDVQFGADFVPNASDVSGAYFGAVLGGNLPLIVVGIKRVSGNMEP